MIVAFCLYKYFPFGGLQRDFMRIAQTVAARGHHVRVYTQSWEGECPDVFELIKVPVKSHTNHGRNAEYFAWVQKHLREHPVDKVVGFNKMPGLDVYYAADVCYAEKVAQEKGFFYRLTSRYRHYAAFERATFEQISKSPISRNIIRLKRSVFIFCHRGFILIVNIASSQPIAVKSSVRRME